LFEPLILRLLIADVSSDCVLVPADRVHEEPPRPKVLSHEVALALAIDPGQVDRALPLDVPDDLGSHSRPSMKLLSCEWLLTLELRRWTAGYVKLLLPPRQSRGVSCLR